MAALGPFEPDVTSSLHPSFAAWFEAQAPGIPVEAALAVLRLVAEGHTPPFLARYRRETVLGLDEAAVRRVVEAKAQFDRLLSRQSIIVESIERHATLTPQLRERILATFDADGLEDLYHPYRQQKKNRALAAREAGLEPLADWIWNTGHGTEAPQEGQTLELWAFTFRNEEKGIADAKAAIEGARDILVERLASDPELRALVRRAYLEDGVLRATKTDKAKPHSRHEPYFAFEERVAALREAGAHGRYHAIRRGQSDGEIQLAVGGPSSDPEFEARLVAAFEARACTVPGAPGAEVLRHAARIAFKNDVRTSVENEVHRVLKEAADAAAAHAFAQTVRRPLLEPPFGPQAVLGIDPGTREGCRVVSVDAAGACRAGETVHLQTDEQKAGAREALVRLAREGGARAFAVGNGSAGRETQILARAALRESGIDAPVVLVDEAGASAWGASDAAKAELPALDPAARAAVSIARRLQDPLAELVKVDPRTLGAGQHHHDVAHATLRHALDAVVESCVHGVGVDLNTAPAALLARVAGLGPALADAIVQHRATHGPFRSRRQLLEVPRVDARAFEQAAGFLRVRGGDHPLDDTRVHPERYADLEALAERLGKSVADLRGSGAALVREAVALKEAWGEATFEDVIRALEEAGRDPRGPFVPFAFRDDVRCLEDVKPGMCCPGIVTNVTAFGAFVDVGARQDGLVHVSQLPRPAKDPAEVLSPGDRVEVRVLKVDREKKQISLTMKAAPPRPARPKPAHRPPEERAPQRRPAAERRVPPPAAGGTKPTPRPEVRRDRPPRPARPAAGPPPEKRPEPRRQVFNNPFAVLAGLKVPPKK
jgi:uncharacterized protein